jgi:hypothetical protein
MPLSTKVRVVALVAAMGLLFPATAGALPPSVADATSTFEYSKNMKPLGFSPRVIPLANAEPGAGSFNSDLAFWGDMAVQGSYAGFRLIDISSPANPREIINWEECASRFNSQGNQGDVIIWEDLIIRSWNSPTPAAGSQCGNWPMAPGEEGLHVIDISDPLNPNVVAFVDTPSGSHTATLVPDLDNNRLIVYNNSAPGGGFDMIQVPLDDPASASYLGPFITGGGCHDWAVILGDVMRAACSGGGGFRMFSLGGPSGGSLDDPELLYFKPFFSGHSAAFTWDGRYLVFGWEPGGGSGARCTATGTQVTPTTVQTDDMKSYFFFDVESGDEVGKFVMPRDQTITENCTIHNYNIVPTDKRYVLVSGNYQSGISVVDFTDPANAKEIAYADPAPLINPDNPAGIELGGDWSTYWYNGRIYESDITRGLIIWDLSDPAVAGAKRFDHLNPQTAMTSFPFKGTAFGQNK